MPPYAAATARGSFNVTRLVIAVTATVITFAVGIVPVPAHITVESCYVTYDRLERMHSRCAGQWERFGVDNSGSVYGVPVGSRWRALDGPDDNYEWEVVIPESSRSYDGITLFRYGWVTPKYAQVLLAVAVWVVVAFLYVIVVGRLLRFARSRLAGATEGPPGRQPAA